MLFIHEDTSSYSSTITESYYLEHCSSFQKLRDCSRYIKLTAANGLDNPIVGILVVTVSLNDLVYQDVPILVVKDPSNPQMMEKKKQVPGILGCNLLDLMYHAMKSKLITNEHSILQDILKTYGARVSLCEEIETLCQTKEVLSFVKTMGKHVFILANSSCILTGTTRQMPNSMVALVEPIENSVCPELIIIPSFSRVEDGRITFEVANCSSQDIWLHKPTRLAKLCVANELVPELDVAVESQSDGSLSGVISNQHSSHLINSFDSFPFQLHIGNFGMTKLEGQQL